MIRWLDDISYVGGMVLGNVSFQHDDFESDDRRTLCLRL